MEIYVNPDKELEPGLCLRPSTDNPLVQERVAGILERVKKDGDSALKALAREIDGLEIESIECSEDEFAEAASLVPEEVKTAIKRAASNIRAFHKAQMPSELDICTEKGVRCVQRPVAVERVGLYIPGGSAPLFSTVLMLAIPARIAGCREIVLCTPASRESGKVAPEVLYAAEFCGVDKVYKVGGAQAIAAMAYGTESIEKVNKIFGPGNQYVTAAKQLIGNRQTAIDLPAGPSEVMVLADGTAVPAFVAADLLSQAEHGPDSQVMLVCNSEEFAREVMQEVDRQKALLPRCTIADKALTSSKAIIYTGPDARERMTAFSNEYAPEHLILAVRDPWELAGSITAAGSIFIGNYSPESAGDYASGTNHTLPTCAWAKSFSGVNLDSFLKKVTIQEITREGLSALGGTIWTMAEAEGLQAHANAVKIRLEK